MSMPQHFHVVVICERYPNGSEVAAAVTSLLKCFQDTRGIRPYLVAAATFGTCRLALSNTLSSRGIILSEPVQPSSLNPKMIDLWLALDDNGKNTARRMIAHSGPAPSGFYRNVFPDPIATFDSLIPEPPSDRSLIEWLDTLSNLVEPWRNRLWKAFCDSS